MTGDQAETHAERVRLRAERYARGLDLWTGEPIERPADEDQGETCAQCGRLIEGRGALYCSRECSSSSGADMRARNRAADARRKGGGTCS